MNWGNSTVLVVPGNLNVEILALPVLLAQRKFRCVGVKPWALWSLLFLGATDGILAPSVMTGRLHGRNRLGEGSCLSSCQNSGRNPVPHFPP